jgi:hypothetical protein
MNNSDGLRALLNLLQRLDRARIHFTLTQAREDAVMIQVTVPGERWEIELVDYGDEFHWEIERFTSPGKIEDESALKDLFARFSDEEPAASHDATVRE